MIYLLINTTTNMRIIEWLHYDEDGLSEVITNRDILVNKEPQQISIDNRHDVYPEIPDDKKDIGKSYIITPIKHMTVKELLDAIQQPQDGQNKSKILISISSEPHNENYDFVETWKVTKDFYQEKLRGGMVIFGKKGEYYLIDTWFPEE